ncbi:GATA zinc finger domain-containing protein 10-like [Macrobrachium nipponense]|uniref:GATA zinc finger domain-containing protein 10-like n=1 Tax=Macrobrachium nipponense TaxID=159736 RepID=UPI0030C7DEF9
MNVGVPLFNKTSQGHLRATGLQPTQIENDFIYLNSYEEFHNNPIPGTSQETQPQEASLVFAVQPPDKYRFRYLSENGSHGQLKTNSVFPKVELKNFHKPGPVEIKVEIYTWDPDPKKRQPHRILQFKQRKGLKSSISYTCYKRKGCFHTELKGVRIMKLTKSDLQKEHKMTYEAAEAAWSQDRDLPGCLRVEASYQNNVIGTIYSNTITTLLPSSLRIHNVFPKHLRAREELCILTDLVKKNDIEVFLMNEDTHNELMCPIKTYHHRFTIVCKIPEIRNQDNTNPVQLKLYLQRPSDNTMSNYYEVTYTNDYYLPRKRKRASLQGPEDWDVCSDLTPLQSQQQYPIQQQQQQQQYDPQLQQQWHWDQSVCQQQHHPHESSQSQLQHEQQLMPIVQQVPNYLVPHQQNPAVPQQSQNQQVSPIPNHVQVPGNQESPSNYFSFSDESGQSQSSFSNSAPAGHLLNMGLTQHGEVQSHTGHGQFPEGLGNKMDCTTNDKYDNNFSGQQNHPIRSLDNTYMSNSDSNAIYSYGPLGNNTSQYKTIYDDSFDRDYEYDSCSNEDDSRPNNTRRSQDAPLPKDFRDEEEENKANQGIQTSNTLDVDETTQFEEDDKQKAYRFGEMDQLIKGTEHINIKRETEVRDTATNTSYYTGSIPNGRFNEKDSQYADHAERTDRSAEKTDQSESIEEEGKQNRPLLIGVNISKKDPKQRNDSNSNTTGNPEQDKDKSYDNGGEKNFERLLANAEPDSEIISTGKSQKSLDTGLYEKHPSGADIKEKNLYSTEGNIKMNNHFARRVRNNTKDATRKEASTVQDYNNPGDKTENDEQSSRISETEVQQSLESQNKSENSEQNNSEFIYKVQMTTQVKNKSDRQGEETTEDGEGGKEEEVQEEFGDEKEKKAEEKQEVEEEEEGEDDEEEEGEDEGEEEEAEGDNDVEEEEEEEDDEGRRKEEEVFGPRREKWRRRAKVEKMDEETSNERWRRKRGKKGEMEGGRMRKNRGGGMKHRVG